MAAVRGHKVTLYEEDAELGGQWILTAALPYKQDFMELVKWETRQLNKLGVKVHTGTRVTPSLVERQKPEAIIIATGARPFTPPIPGINSKKAVNAWEVIENGGKVGNRVLIIGSERIGLETAEFLANKGKRVRVAAGEHVGNDMGSTIRFHLLNSLAKLGVNVMRGIEVKSINDGEVKVVTKEGKAETWRDIDSIVIAMGSVSQTELAEKVKDKVKEVYVIGDAQEPRDGIEAVREGAEAGVRI